MAAAFPNLLFQRAMKSILLFALAGFFAAAVRAQNDAPVITRAPVTADEKPAAAPRPTPSPAAALADLRDQNKQLSTELASAWKENDKLKTSALAQVAAANQKTDAIKTELDAATKENETLKAQLADAKKTLDGLHQSTAASASDSAALTAAKADRDKLAADVLKAKAEENSLAAELDAAQNDLAAQKQKTSDAEAERDQLKQKLVQATTSPAAPAAADTSALDDLKKQEAETEDRLNTSLHAYTLLQAENDQLKDTLAKTTDEKNSVSTQLNDAKGQIADLTPKAAAANAAAAQAANELAAVRDQLRQTQNLVAQLAAENSSLKTRLAFASQAGAAPPERPAAIAPPPPPPAPVAPPPPAGPHSYKVRAGDTLGKISKQFYGTSNRWQDILAANKDKLRDDKSLRVGMELKIP